MTNDSVIELGDALAILRRLQDLGGRPFAWEELAGNAIDRGAHAIVPLAVAPVSDALDAAASDLLRERAQVLERDCIHFYGGDWFHAEMRLDLDAGFGRRLVETSSLSSRPRYWWGIGGFAVVVVRCIDRTGAFETLALHILPKNWVWISPITPSTKRDVSHARRVLREQETIAGVADLGWSWPLPAADALSAIAGDGPESGRD